MVHSSSSVVAPSSVTKINYALKTCGRCGGSGHYSYNSLHGTVCYGCKGRKQVLTPQAKKSQAAIANFMKANFSVAIEALVAGDRIKIDGVTRTLASVVKNDGAQFGSTVDGVTTWRDGYTLTFTKPVPSSFGAFTALVSVEGSTYVRAVTGADWQQVVAFAATLKGVIFVTS